MESKVEKFFLEWVGRKIQKSNIFVVPQHNIGGGLALFWPNDRRVDIQSYSDRQINVIIGHGVDDAWRFTGFYEDPDTTSWEDS